MQSFELDSELLKACKTLKAMFTSFSIKRKFFYLQERHTNMKLELPNKNFFFNNYIVDIFLFITVIVLMVVTTIVMYIQCKHMKLKTLVTSLALQQIKEIGMVADQEGVTLAQDIYCTCKIQWYTIFVLCLSILGLVLFVSLKSRNLKLFRGHLFSNTVKIVLFISDAQYNVLIKLCRIAGTYIY